MKNKNILVTRGAGFSGSNLCETLVSMWSQAVGIDNFPTGKHENMANFLSKPNFRSVEGEA